MNGPASIPQHIWDSLSDEARVVIGVVVDGLERQVTELKQKVQGLKARVDQNSANSSRPPSSDPIGVKRKPPSPPSRRSRGGQKGHPRRIRAFAAPDRVASITDCKPAECRRCGHPLGGEDAEPRRHQVADLPPIEPEVHEYRLHRLACPHCKTVTSAALPEGVPRASFGPRLHAALSVLTGAYRLGKRQVTRICSDLLGLRISLGMIAKLERITSDALEQPVAELAERVKAAGAANIDETGWREEGPKAWLWVVATSLGVVFRVARSRSGAIARGLLGAEPKPIVISDRFPGYEWIELKSRQVCWAHLRRDMQAMVDRDGDGAEVGRRLLWQSGKLFESWHKARDGTIRRTTFLQTVAWLRPMVRLTLESGAACTCPKTATTCVELLRLWDCLWTFTRVEGVEPTNNAAERALRHAVIWRRTSGGTDSEAGSRFVERMLSAVATCRQQGRDVLDYVTECHRAHLAGRGCPSLLPGVALTDDGPAVAAMRAEGRLG
ncbi:IS66 family transposase [Paludisphaera soli]|uniref:IS66 family transposase n=1 Tax=Paludisphaera soli TaxID=2712865 RepID=UPI001F0EB182|nr:IS66 family transposase [Paludisphaera soli]